MAAKTQANDPNVAAFVDAAETARRCEGAQVLLDVFAEVAGFDAVMWGA